MNQATFCPAQFQNFRILLGILKFYFTKFRFWIPRRKSTYTVPALRQRLHMKSLCRLRRKSTYTGIKDIWKNFCELHTYATSGLSKKTLEQNIFSKHFVECIRECLLDSDGWGSQYYRPGQCELHTYATSELSKKNLEQIFFSNIFSNAYANAY